jgi:hypothetical protein
MNPRPPVAASVLGCAQNSLKFYYKVDEVEDPPVDDDNFGVGAFGAATFNQSAFQFMHLSDAGKVLYQAPPLAPRA